MNEKKQASRFDLNSRFMKAFLLVIAVLLIFVGPTYVVYVLVNVIELNYAVSMVSGFALFAVGMVFLWFLIRKKVVS